MLGLGDLPGGDFSSHAYGVSPDGHVIVGVGKSMFDAEAFRTDASPRVTTYWGREVVDLVPGEELDVVVRTYPAGRLRGEIQLIDGSEPPPVLDLALRALEPREHQPVVLPIRATSGRFELPLPSGGHRLEALSFEASNGRVHRMDAFAFSMEHGDVLDLKQSCGNGGKKNTRRLVLKELML